MLDLLSSNPLVFALIVVVLILSLSVHEMAHAWVADKLGDPTARLLGRVTMNPLAHLDPIGILFLIVFRFGWGKPVPFNSLNLKNPRRDGALISLAGPGSNFIIATIFAIIAHLVGYSTSAGSVIYSISLIVVQMNLLLGFFNLLPFGPLDGFKIVYGFLPVNLAMQWAQVERYGLLILIFMVFTNSIGTILTPLINISLQLLGL